MPATPEAIDVDAYFDRVGHDGEISDLSGLSSLHAAHMDSIPFENLDVLLGRGVYLEPGAVFDKLVTRRRGGYCFEHATLMATVLQAKGAHVELLTARPRFRIPAPVTPRTHALLGVDVDGRRYLVDPGFGGPGPRLPIPLEAGAEVDMGSIKLCLVPLASGELCLRREAGGEVDDLYHVSLEPCHPIDLFVANHFTSTHPLSVFTQRIMANRGGVSVMNRQVTRRTPAGVETQELDSRAELRRVFAEELGIDEPELETLVVPSVPEWA